MLDHRARLGIMAVTAELWARLREHYARLPAAVPTVVPLDLTRLIGTRPVARSLGQTVLLIPESPLEYDVIHAALHAAAMLLTVRSGGRLYSSRGRISSAFVGWAATLGLSVAYDARTGFGRTSMSVDALLRHREDASAISEIISAAEARLQRPLGLLPRPERS